VVWRRGRCELWHYRNDIRDRDGELRDLVMLAHYVDGTWSGMSAVGLTDEIERTT
jgi:hypothetical protein